MCGTNGQPGEAFYFYSRKWKAEVNRNGSISHLTCKNLQPDFPWLPIITSSHPLGSKLTFWV